MERRLADVDDAEPVRRARRRLFATGAGYVEFALAETGLFRLLFTAYPDPPDGKGAAEAGEDPYGMLNAALDDLVAVGYLGPDVRAGADVTCWSAVHGFAVLNVEGPLRGLPPAERERALEGLLLSIDRGLGVGGRLAGAGRALTGSPQSLPDPCFRGPPCWVASQCTISGKQVRHGSGPSRDGPSEARPTARGRSRA